MGQIAGIKLPGESAFANDTASMMLQSIGVDRPTCLFNYASSDKENFATLGFCFGSSISLNYVLSTVFLL